MLTNAIFGQPDNNQTKQNTHVGYLLSMREHCAYHSNTTVAAICGNQIQEFVEDLMVILITICNSNIINIRPYSISNNHPTTTWPCANNTSRAFSIGTMTLSTSFVVPNFLDCCDDFVYFILL